MSSKKHPFSYTLGPGPYKYMGVFDLGAAMLQMKSGNTSGYENSMKMAPKVERGMGTCAHCNHAIMYVMVVKTSEGKLFGVGSDCVLKIVQESELENANEFEKQQALFKRKKGQEQREALRKRKAQAFSERVEENKERLSNLAHPSKHFSSQGRTALDYFNFVLSGRMTIGAIKIAEIKLNKMLNGE